MTRKSSIQWNLGIYRGFIGICYQGENRVLKDFGARGLKGVRALELRGCRICEVIFSLLRFTSFPLWGFGLRHQDLRICA